MRGPFRRAERPTSKLGRAASGGAANVQMLRHGLILPDAQRAGGPGAPGGPPTLAAGSLAGTPLTGLPTPSRRRTTGCGLGQAAGGAGPLPGVGPPRLRRPRPATPPAVASQARPARAAAQAAAAQAHDSPHSGTVGTAHLYQLCGPGALPGANSPAARSRHTATTPYAMQPLAGPGRCVPLAVPAPPSTHVCSTPSCEWRGQWAA